VLKVFKICFISPSSGGMGIPYDFDTTVFFSWPKKLRKTVGDTDYWLKKLFIIRDIVICN
jgi:hypothetical protein